MTYAERYRERIGHRGAVAVDRALLDDLLRLHVATIPFENATSFGASASLAGAVDMDLEAVADKLLGAVSGGPRRGGYCVEHSILLQDVLPELGFSVRGALGRVFGQPGLPPGTRTHYVTVVTLDGKALLADPGNGGMTPTGSLDLDDLYAVQSTPHDRYRVIPMAEAGVDRSAAPEADVVVQLAMTVDGQESWRDLYTLGLGPVAPRDVAVSNWYTSTSPDSFFTTSFAAALAPEGMRITLADTVIRHRSGGSADKRQLGGIDDLRTALGEVEIDLMPQTLAAVSGRLFGRASS